MKRRNFIKGVPLVAGGALLPAGAIAIAPDNYHDKYWEAQAKIDALEEELYHRKKTVHFSNDEAIGHDTVLKMNKKYRVK